MYTHIYIYILHTQHPDVACPLCGYNLPMYEMNAHVAICLETPEHLRLSNIKHKQNTEYEQSRDINIKRPKGMYLYTIIVFVNYIYIYIYLFSIVRER